MSPHKHSHTARVSAQSLRCGLQGLSSFGTPSLGQRIGQVAEEVNSTFFCQRGCKKKKILGNFTCYYSLNVRELLYVLNVLTLMILPAN